MTLEFREADAADLPDIVEMLRDDVLGAGRESQSLTAYEDSFSRMKGSGTNTVIVALHAGKIVGTYQFITIEGLSLTAMKRAQVESVRIASDLRGQGLGALLMADAEKRARDCGCGMIQLTTNQKRTDTHRFYERLGFEQSHFGYKLML